MHDLCSAFDLTLLQYLLTIYLAPWVTRQIEYCIIVKPIPGPIIMTTGPPMYKPLAPCLLLLSLTACQMAPTADVATTPKTSVSQSHQQLQRIMDDAWQLRLESKIGRAHV